jgi:ABC-2 type transport system permease protein
VRPIWDVILQMLFYGTPILYPIEAVMDENEEIATVMMCNPLAIVIEQIRHTMIDPSAPTPTEVLGDGWLLLVPISIVVAACAIGYRVFDREAPRIAEEL